MCQRRGRCHSLAQPSHETLLLGLPSSTWQGRRAPRGRNLLRAARGWQSTLLESPDESSHARRHSAELPKRLLNPVVIRNLLASFRLALS